MAIERFIGGPYHGKSQEIDGEPKDYLSFPCSPPHPDSRNALYARDRRTGDQLFRGYYTRRDDGLESWNKMGRAA